MPVLMILQGGPLDGEEQMVENLNTTPGFQMEFNIPNFQTFGPDGESVAGLGLVAVYAYQGAGPNPGPNDTWTSSSIYGFVEEHFIPQPPPLFPPGGGPGPQPLPPAVFFNASSGLVVNANDPSAGVQMVGEGDMAVDATVTSFGYATVAMVAETTMVIFRQPWSNVVSMVGTTTMTVTPN